MKQFAQFKEIVQVDNIHFSKLHFSHFKVQEYREELTDYFASAGSFVKELTLNFVDNEMTLEELEYVFLSSVPQLESLALDRLPCDFFGATAKLSGMTTLKKLTKLRLNTRCHYNNDEERSIEFFISLLRMTPNLKYLNGAVEWCLPRLVTSLSIVKLKGLTDLVLKGCFDCPTAQKLASSDFNLKTLYLGTSGYYDLGRKHNILYSKRHTLRALGLGWASFMKRIDLETISDEYKELTCLSLCDASKWSLCGSPYSGPGLKRLLADIRMECDFIYLENRRQAFEKTRELNLRFLTFQVSEAGLVDRMAAVFPVVRLLTLQITESFPISRLWTAFPNLEELSLLINSSAPKVDTDAEQPIKYMDDVLTGLSEEECKKLRGYSDENLMAYQLEHEESSLLNMKNLRKIVISGGSKHISKVTAYLCLCNVAGLTSITLDRVTRDCKDVLLTKLSPGTHKQLTE
jgi:hypothetical protein